MHTPSVDPTERLFSPQTVCVWATGVYLARALLGPSIPNTKAEVYALARDSGAVDPVHETGNFTKLAYGMAKRYGLKGLVYEVDAEAKAKVLAAALRGPHAVGLAGNQLNLTPHWQSGSIGHAIAVIYEHGTTGVQYDPLAPAGYAGDPFGPAELAKFATAAIIFKEEDTMPGFKNSGPAIGKFTFVGDGHALISPTDTKVRYPQADGASFDVFAQLGLRNAAGDPVDIEGNAPPLNKRGQVYLVDAPAFGVAAYALRQDGTFIPTPPGYSEDDLQAAKKVAADIVARAASNEASKF